MSSGLYSGVSGLALGTGLYRNVSGLWSGASGLIDGFGGGGPFPGASLYLDFTNPVLDPRITFSRGTGATRVNASGFIEVVGNTDPRFDYDPVTLAPRGLLIEEARTNLLTYSEQFDNAAWTKTAATVTANATASPDGTVNADKVAEDATTALHFVRQNPTVTAVAHTLSFYAKAAERTVVWATLDGASNTRWFDLAAVTTGGSTGNSGSSTITAVGNGWFRCTYTYTFAGTTSSCFVGPALNSSTLNYAGTAGSGFFIYGAQLEAGASATSYIPTVASTVSRSADTAQMTGTNFSTWFSAAAGTFIADFDVVAVDTSTRRKIWNGSDGGNQRLALRSFDTTINYPIAAIGTGSTVISLSGTALTANTVTRVAVAYGANSALSQNGATPVTDANANSVAVTSLGIGYDQFAVAQQLNGHIRAIAYYNTRLPNTQLQTLTAPSLASPLALDFISPTYTVGY